MFEWFKSLVLGKPRDIEDPHVFHNISLVAFLAWVGLGADGLSSSAYGPDESFRALGQHHYLALGLVVAIAFTVFIISYAYSRIIEHFPFGGGGYVVASKLLGPRWGVVSGSALLIDYVLTISVSIAAGADACFSFLPLAWHPWKFPIEIAVIVALMLMNLRGVKESVTILVPIFLLFLLTHAVLIFGTLASSAGNFPSVVADVHAGYSRDMAAIGFAGIFALFMRSYSMGAGTYTGIEAVSNGLQIMREPRVQTAQRTMIYMAISLAVTAGGIALSYLLVHAKPVEGQTMNAVLVGLFAQRLPLGPDGQHAFAVVTLVSEAVLLFVAAQTGFIDAPRVMANMANDSWLPHRFRTLSDRLTMQDGVILTSTASILTLLYTRGETSTLVLMYSINVFLTFSLSEGGMVRYWFRHRDKYPDWSRHISIHVVGLILCLSILVVSLFEKFTEGGWVTLALTSALIALCLLIRKHYAWVRRNLSRLDEILASLPAEDKCKEPAPLDPKAPTAILLVGGYGGLGIHSLLTIQRLFPGYFKNFIFVSIGVIDTASFKGVEEVEAMRKHTEESLKRYVDLARCWGLASDYRCEIGIEVLDEAEQLCLSVSRQFPRSIVFTGKLVFEQERWFQRLLHNETAYQLQRRLQFAGLNTMVLPVRVLAPAQGQTAAASAAA